MKNLILLVLLMAPVVACADVKITALPQDSSPTVNDITIEVDEPSTSSPVTKKVTWAAIRTLMLQGNGSSLTGLTMSQVTGNLPETQISFSDITTNNVTTSAHGFAPKLPNDATKFLNGVGGYTVPSTSSAGGFTDNGTSVGLTTSTDNVVIGTTTTSSDKLHVLGAISASGAITGSNLSGTNTGDQTITLLGAVTGVGTGTITTSIPNASITEAKLAATLTSAIGGTGFSTAADDAVLLGNGTIWQSKVISDCQDTAGQHLNYNASTNSWSCGTSGSSTASGWTSDSSTKTTTTYNVGIGTTTPRGILDITTGSAYLPTINAGTWNGTAIGYAYGGTGLTAANDDNVMVGSGSGWQSKAITDCQGAGKAVTYTASSNSFGCNTISTASVAWGSITGDVTSQNWQSTAGFLPRGSINWTDLQNMTVGVNWGSQDEYAKSWNAFGSGVGGLRLYDTAGTNWSGWNGGTTALQATFTVPVADGTAGMPLITDGSKVTSFGGAKFIQSGSAPTITTVGHIGVDTTDDQLKYYGGAVRVLAYKNAKSFVIDSPISSSDYPIWKVPYAITITAIHVLDVGGTNTIGGLDICNSNGASCSAVDSDITAGAGTNADDDGTLSSASVSSGSYLYWHTTSVSGTPTSVTVSLEYTVNAT